VSASDRDYPWALFPSGTQGHECTHGLKAAQSRRSGPRVRAVIAATSALCGPVILPG
jgi:hypothetical protein